MSERYEVTAMTRWVNRITSLFARSGRGRTELLLTTGRKSGQTRLVPVSPIEIEGNEYLVAPYGEVSWVRNVRADPQATLRHGSRGREVTLHEVDGEEAAPVVAAYYSRETYPRKYMDVPADPSLDDFGRAAHRFPVFRVETTA
jgi:deazaflavin-dependent oxidoreductase (nitroreductase family)